MFAAARIQLVARAALSATARPSSAWAAAPRQARLLRASLLPPAQCGLAPAGLVARRAFSSSSSLLSSSTPSQPPQQPDALLTPFEFHFDDPLARADAARAAVDAISTTSDATTATVVHAIGDLHAAGLASAWTPVGWIQQGLEVLHATAGLPWWASIAAMTVGIRFTLFPLMVKLQRNAVVMHNIRPELDRITAMIQTAQQSGDAVAMKEAAMAAQDLFHRHNVHPLKALGVPLMQAPIMISFFLAIRNLAEANIPSFAHGGLAWFTDLGAADPYYALPIAASAGFLTVIELGAETGVRNAQTDTMRKYMRIAGVAMVPLTASMPSGVFVYWITSNLFTLVQAQILKNETIRAKVGIPKLIAHEPVASAAGTKEMGFMDGFKAALEAASKENEEKARQQKMQEPPRK
ncbi:YidC/Oxa1 family membrane protein insertase [Allomyces macrogynus ATCC 38327]|uniref:YidC/Oxa1 family membrane protein insertase n=1 Tax=Allomyces macrogynus (strain ATCC 38327) TaxID=578462 RepID=A0A0L0SNU3_ALLM3|nr:YidC/Oxa1 family membrane protein insertase [Allomyces macrogynus ATCC 38327]|eukprot:KNE64167.1 YidC/Oxa1 family membrane protein insertase [Allomyces macrogynus ATCC 38327]